MRKKLKKILVNTPLIFLAGFSVFTHAAIDRHALNARLKSLENHSGGRLGISVIDTSDGARFSWRGNERFPMCSTSKVMVVASVLQKSEKDKQLLDHKVFLKKSDMVNYNPVTQKHINSTMTVGELSVAALQFSDNAAMNKLLELIGGLRHATLFARGDWG
ncbi:hypothetical protein E05_01440 [Plautia stali symbiont]|nr:hypothetical protein E05_01440 [Plautia stali symbiont]